MDAAVRNKFDLLISDIALPDGTGMDLMVQMRAIANVPGIAISGFGNNGDIERSLQAGFSEHLIKPIKLDNFRPPSNGRLARPDNFRRPVTATFSPGLSLTPRFSAVLSARARCNRFSGFPDRGKLLKHLQLWLRHPAEAGC